MLTLKGQGWRRGLQIVSRRASRPLRLYQQSTSTMLCNSCAFLPRGGGGGVRAYILRVLNLPLEGAGAGCFGCVGGWARLVG